ncbi:hypothetical protein EGH22_08100 [Halomicroarcula sp. F28]|uniref:HalOD1 output domain-containing protein n=1 Tax=Haloarcula salinisoli TaxID=2487746 RepID=UPI001C72E9E9|nr:HalOD1 output domain-containing protein [Halomicroarcula salinisoli]MBX0286285.1 hypothetical protein [Halomicroarcula salinisoli]
MGRDRGGVVRKQVEETELVHETVLRAVSAATGHPTADLTPLQTAIDVDAMDLLMSSPKNARSLQFQYMGFDIIVEPDHVCIQEPDESATES